MNLPLSAQSENCDVPRHLAIIMDGNGRWAAAHHMPRKVGHQQGIEAVRRTVRGARELKVKFLTLYGFSSENWRRPAQEINDLMGLLRRFIRNDLTELHQNDVRIRVIGSRENLEPDIIQMIGEAESLTQRNQGLQLTIAFNYGAKNEITMAARRIAGKILEGTLNVDDLTVDCFAAHLYTRDLPPVDLLIRTSGEKRLSNFMLWQCAYAEFLFMDVLWPDFGKDSLLEAFDEFRRRDRRFGRTIAEPAM